MPLSFADAVVAERLAIFLVDQDHAAVLAVRLALEGPRQSVEVVGVEARLMVLVGEARARVEELVGRSGRGAVDTEWWRLLRSRSAPRTIVTTTPCRS